jgi:hypothetical protein
LPPHRSFLLSFICGQVRPLADAAFGAKNYALTAEGHDAHGGRLRLQEGGGGQAEIAAAAAAVVDMWTLGAGHSQLPIPTRTLTFASTLSFALTLIAGTTSDMVSPACPSHPNFFLSRFNFTPGSNALFILRVPRFRPRHRCSPHPQRHAPKPRLNLTAPQLYPSSFQGLVSVCGRCRLCRSRTAGCW